MFGKWNCKGMEMYIFHLVIDKFFHYYYLQALWNKNIEKLGYVSNYSEKNLAR